MSPRRLPRFVPVLLAALFLVALFVWSEGLLNERVGPGGKGAAPAPPWKGAVATAEMRDVARAVEATGTVEPVLSATLSARVTGVVDDVRAREGDRVKQGDLLVRLSAPELAARSASAAGAAAAADAALQQARRDVARMEALRSRDAATQVEVEQARTAVAVAEAELARAREAGAAEAAIASHAVLRAPFSGLVLERFVDPGDLASPGVPLLRIGDDAAFQLEAAVDETDAVQLARGDVADVEVESAGLRAQGAILEIVPAADPGSRTQIVKVALPASPALRSGLFGRVRLPGDTRRAVVVPKDALRRAGGLASVRVLDDAGVARMRAVRAGDEVEPGVVEILAGLGGGEKLAIGTEAAP